MKEHNIYDCIGIGFGPSNIALAIAMKEKDILSNSIFLESKDEHSWHPGMMMEGTDIQHNPLRDLVTPRNPTSKYGFLSYLKNKNRLFDYLNLDAPYPPRTEYASYVNWVAAQFNSHVHLGVKSEKINLIDNDIHGKLWEVSTVNKKYISKVISFGTGRSALIPEIFSDVMGEKVIHLNDYLFFVDKWKKINSNLNIGVIGGSQSAIEIILDISSRMPDANIFGISRGFGFKQKDLSPFTEQIYYPSFVDYFHGASEKSQAHMTKELWRSNYGSADHDVISTLNFKLYEQKVTGKEKIKLFHNNNVKNILVNNSGKIELNLLDKHTQSHHNLILDGLIVATGFKNFGTLDGQEPYHPLLNEVVDNFKFRNDGGIMIARDFSLVSKEGKNNPSIFINGLAESTHGFGDAGSFSLLSTRSNIIANSIQDTLRNYSV